jgi:glutathione S-transferase
MILIGHYDSPFVRRVAIALRFYGMAYEHRAWSVFAQSDEIAAYNPLKRVPTLVLEDGEVLIESGAILDWLDEAAGPERALIAASGLERRQALKVCALATGLADKGVSLVYERAVHNRTTALWVERCQSQIGGVLDALEADRAARPGRWWFGEQINHADVAVACVLRFLCEAHPEVFDRTRWPVLAAHAKACEALPEFTAVLQPFFVAEPRS